MHGTIKRKIDRKAELSAIKREWYRAHKARLNTFLNSPQATDADKATRGDAKLSKHVGLRVASDGIPPWDRPPFDLGVFKNKTRDAFKLPPTERVIKEWITFTRRSREYFINSSLKGELSRTTGVSLFATWKGGNVANPIAKVTKRALSYEQLLAATRKPLNTNRRFAFHNRWAAAVTSFSDIRIAGKFRRISDETLRTTDDNRDYLNTSPQHDVHVREYYRQRPDRDCAQRFYDNPVLVFFWLWLLAYLEPDEPHRYIPSNIYWQRGECGERIARTASLRELLSKEALERGRNLKRSRRLGFLTAQEELDLARRGKAGDIPARDEIIGRHWKLVDNKVRHVPVADQVDAVAQGMEALFEAWDKWNPERNVRFGAFAAQLVEWRIQDFMRERRRQVPVAQSINANNPVADNTDTERAENMMTNNAMQTQVKINKMRLIAERIGCLSAIERNVVEHTLGLNGYRSPDSEEELAAELGMTDRHLRRIKRAAEMKLRAAVL